MTRLSHASEKVCQLLITTALRTRQCLWHWFLPLLDCLSSVPAWARRLSPATSLGFQRLLTWNQWTDAKQHTAGMIKLSRQSTRLSLVDCRLSQQDSQCVIEIPVNIICMHYNIGQKHPSDDTKGRYSRNLAVNEQKVWNILVKFLFVCFWACDLSVI